ncbi:MAG: flavin reductase family protein [Candidatus Accumulibacter sp.]|jgi:flavin reductase (DIM6/NTAB) family NADH-FMN oxidoreductase RutF|nr:flavin reductase family protein [Accumulibacter sp.]
MSNETRPVDPAKCHLLLNHGPVTLVSAAFHGRRNVMAASWVMPLDFDPPKVAAVIDGRGFTRELIDASGEFALSVPFRRIARKVLAAGSISGREGDKFVHAGLATFPASVIGAPLVRDCAAWLECKVIPEKRLQRRYDLFVAEVVAAWADPAVFSGGRWHFPDTARKTIHYQAGGAFFATGGPFDCAEG